MKNNRLLNIIGGINERHIAEAAPVGKKSAKPVKVKWGIAAACVVLVAALGIVGFMSGLFGGKNDIIALKNGEYLTFVKCDTSVSVADSKYFPREIRVEDVKLLFEVLPVSAYAYVDPDSDKIVGLEGEINNCKLVVFAKGENLLDTVIEGKECTSTVEGVDVNAGYFVTKANSEGIKTIIYYADFEIGDSCFYLESSGVESEREAVKANLADTFLKLVENGDIDLSKIHE